jgi:hypothetical protein
MCTNTTIILIKLYCICKPPDITGLTKQFGEVVML